MVNPPEYPFEKQWHDDENVAVIGWSYDENGHYLSGAGLAGIFKSLTTREDFSSLLQRLNGHFAVIISTADFMAAAVDHIRSIPILYKLNQNGLEFLSGTEGSELDMNSTFRDSFVQCWCVPGNQTLAKDVFQLLPGQHIWWDSSGASDCQPSYYFHHFISPKTTTPKEQLLQAGLQILENIFQRIVKIHGNKTLVVPLSGGYDSRLILAMLYRCGAKNLLTYTYGRTDSHEVSLASEVANQLNVPWHFVEYTEEVFEVFFKDDWKNYSSKNHFLSSLPHEQDFFALHQLRKQGILPADFITLPGFCGDLLGGSITAYQPSSWTEQGLEDFVRTRHFGGIDLPMELNNQFSIVDKESFFDAYQQYFVENKVSKFIVNAVRVYEHFNGDWIMPLWDRQLVDFFYGLPYDFREKQSLYNEILFQRIFTPLGIDFEKPGFDDNYPGTLKERLKSNLPPRMVSILKNLGKDENKSDPNGLQILNEMIFERLNSKMTQCPKEINVTHANYFLQNLKK